MLCPKCRQPLEGDEVYICCGDDAIQWRCAGCGKVSEGFAFPYGQCPYCGGDLAVLEPRSLADADAAALEAIRTAFEIELGGHAFYARAAAEATDAQLRDLFGRLAEMEEEHMATLARRYHVAVPAPSAEFRVTRAAIYAGVDYRPGDPASLFRVAIACEERAARFFSERLAATDAGSGEYELYRELAAEEREHAELLATEYDRWAGGKPGLL